MGVLLGVVAVVGLASVAFALAVWPPRTGWRRWRRLTRPVRRWLHPSRYDRHGNPKAGGEVADRNWHKLASPNHARRPDDVTTDLTWDPDHSG